MKRRMLALLLVIVMLIGMVPTGVFADAASPENSVSAVEAEGSAVETEAPKEETEAPTEEETEAPTEEPTESSEETEATDQTEAADEEPTEETVEEIEDLQADAGTADVFFTVSVEGVLGKTDDGKAAVKLPVTVKDADADGILTFHDALVALHEAYRVDGYTLQRGVTVTKLWGVETYATSFFKNGEELTKMVAYKTSTVEDNDQLYAVVMTDKTDRADCFTWFDKTEVTVKAGESFKLTLTGKCGDYAQSSAARIPVGTWKDGAFTALENAKTDIDGNVTLSFDKAGTYLVTAKGVLTGSRYDYDFDSEEDIDCPTIAPYCVVTVEEAAKPGPADSATVYFTLSNQGVLAQTPDGQAAIELPVTVKDLNSDGILTYDEALVALHEAYCPGGYEISGGFVQKVWNVTTDPKGSNYFLKNNEALSMGVADKTSTVAQGDQLYTCIFKDEEKYSDVICYFDSRALTVEAYKDITLNLQGSSSMAVGGYKAGSVAGAQVGTWKDGTFTAIQNAVTDSKGNVKVSFEEPGTYIVSASGSIETQIANWAGGHGDQTITVEAPLTAPYCVVTVTPAQFVTATVSYTGQGSGDFFATGVDVEVPSNLAERYGFTDNVDAKTGVSALDVLVQAHLDCFGKDFTKASATNYLVVASSGWINKMFGESTSWIAILVNGAMPGNATVNQAKVVDGDDVMFGIYQTAGKDQYTYLADGDGKALDGQTLEAGKKVTLTVMGKALYGGTNGPVSGAKIYLVDTENATLDTTLGTTGSDGKCTVTIPAGWLGKTVYLTANGTNTFMSLAKVTVTEPGVSYATVTFNFQQDGEQVVFAFDEKVASDLAESYGYTDEVVGSVSALDVLVRVHELVFFDQFTPESAKNFLDLGPTDWVIKYMGEESTNLTILVNGKQAAGSDGKGLMINQTEVADGDYILFGVCEDTAYYLDRYVWLNTADGKPLSGQSLFANTDLDLVVMGSYAAYGADGGPDAPVEGAQLAAMDMVTGKIEPITGKVSDEDGKVTLHIPESMANKTVCLVATGEEMFSALNVFKIGNVLKETDLVEVHVGIGGRTDDTVQELKMSPEFLHSTMDYTVDPLVFVADEASRYLWVKVEYIPYCTAGFTFHGVTKTFTEAQNGKWVRLDKLVPGAEASVLTLTSKAEDGYDKTYTVTLSMDKGQAVLWKTDLNGEPLTIGQNAQQTLTVEAGVTRDVDPNTTVSYQWYVNTTASTEGGKAVKDANKADFTVPSGELGTFYYYVVASGDGLESATSQIVEVTVKAVPKSLTLTSDYPYTVPNASSNAYGGVTYAVKQGTQMQLRALDENGSETPVIWKVGGAYGGKLDTETGVYTVTSASYTYVTAVSALDPSVTSGQKLIDVKFYQISDYYKNQTVRLNADGQTVKTASVIGGINGYNIWEVKYPDGVAEITSDLTTKPGSLGMNVLRPGKVEVTLTLDVGPEGAPKLTDTAVLNVTGVAVENADGGFGKAYLELTSENAAPTMQLKAITEEGRSIASWTSANEAVATVDDKGVVTAHAVGTAQITAIDDKGTKGGILAVVSDSQNPTFEKLALFGITSSTFKYQADQKDYTGIKLSNYNTKILTIAKGTLYDSNKLDCVATYTNEDGKAVSIPIPSATQTQLPGMPFGTTLVTLTLTDKTNKDVKSLYTLELTRPRDVSKTISYSNGIAAQDAKGGALSNSLYLDKAEGYLFQASETGVKNSNYTVSNSKYYYRGYLVNGRPDFTLNIKGTTAYTHIRYSIDDGQTWKELPQGGGLTDAITFPKAEGDTHAEVKVIFQILGDQYYAESGFAFPEMTSNKEKLMVDSTQVGTAYTVWMEQLPAVGEPQILTATSDTGNWYPAFTPDTVAYKLSIAQDGDLPTVTFTVAEGNTVKIGSKAVEADESGAYTLELTTSNQTVSVTNTDGSLVRKYTFAASKRIKNGADKVVDYLPINSQYTNGGAYGLSPESMLSGTFKSLGGFGGYATFYFEDGITNDPTNQYGVDFYVYGNANPGQSFAEPGQVWVSEDGNNWYALAGSEHYDSAIWDYTVTYTKDGTGTTWSDNYGHTQADHGKSFSWPLASNYTLNSLVNSDTITLSGILIPAVDGMIGGNTTSSFAHATTFGYADTLVNGESNPYLANDDLALKSSGFDLAWAVDAEGNPVNVDGMSFHYVKVVTASNIMAGVFFEKSTEVQRVYRASSTGSDVGTTAAPTAISFTGNGATYSIIPETGKQVYSVTLPMDAVSVTVSGNAENIYVNNQRVAPGEATKAIDLGSGTKLVRIIAQSGDEQPVIYLLKLTSGASSLQAPEIVSQPASATYLLGMDAEDLTLEAKPASKHQILTYQWFVNTAESYEGAVAIADATGETYALGKAEEAGTRYYFCVVTSTVNGLNCTASSHIVKIEVLDNAGYVEKMLKGTGTEADPYQIAAAEDYQTVYDLVAAGYAFKDQYLAQTKDVTLAEGWKPIGSDSSNRFSGHLDGQNHTLTVPEGGLPLLGYVKDAYVGNLNIYGPQIEGYGLVNNLEGVGLSGNAITIEGVTLKSGTKTLKSGLVGTYITTNSFAGCSGNFMVTIRDCVAERGVVIGYDGTESKIGSFAGRINGTIEGCKSYATVYGMDSVGGIVGNQDNSMTTFKVTDCEFHGTVEASGEEAGGIIGSGYIGGWADNAMRPNISHCTVTGSVYGSNKVGGIQGGDSVVIQTYARTPNEMTGNTFSGHLYSEGEAVGAIVGYYRGLNVYDKVHDNTCESDDTGLRPIGQVAYVDTSAAEHEIVYGLTYFDSSSGTFPTVSGYSRWQKNLNRTDDPLGKDSETICKMKSGTMDPNVDTRLVGGKSTTLKAVGADGNPIPKNGITWALRNAEDAAYATVTPAGAVKTYPVASRHDVTFVGTPKDGSAHIPHTIAIYPAVSQVEILRGRQVVNGQTLYMDMDTEKTLTLTGKLYPTDAMEGLSWKSSNAKVLTVEDGVVTYLAGKGTVTITATAADGSRKAASVKIQVGSLTQSVAVAEPETKVLRAGKSLTLKAVTEPVKPTVPGVTFRLVDSADSAYAAVTAAGKVTAKNVNEPHAVQIQAVSKDAAQVESNVITLTILPKADQSLILKVGEDYVTKTTLAKNVHETLSLAAYTLDVSGEAPAEEAAEVTWKSSNAKVASVAQDGTVTCLKSGSATITALMGKAKATVTIKVTGLVDGITVTTKKAADSLTLASGKTLALKANVEPANASNKAVTWSITEGSAYAKISSSGVITANKDLTGVKTVTVTATAKDGSGASGSAQVTLRPLVQGLEIKRPGASENTTQVWDMAASSTLQLSAVTYPVAARKDVTWKSSNAKVASIDAGGKITCLRAGTVTITATAKDGSGEKASFKLTVVKRMKDLNLEGGIIAGGKSLTLKPVITPADTTNKKLSWSVSENEAGIRISSSGKLTTKAVKERVSVTVTVKALDGSGVTATCKVTVCPATTKVTIGIPGGGSVPKTMAYDELLVLKATSTPDGADGAATVYTWKSSNKLVTVKDGNVTADPKAVGKTVTITATAADGTNKSASIKLKILAPAAPQA